MNEEQRIKWFENQGLTRSDAQGAYEAEQLKLTTVPISGPTDQTAESAGDNLTKKAALALAKKLRADGVFASVYPSLRFPRKQVVIFWAENCEEWRRPDWSALIPEAKSDFRCGRCDQMKPWQEQWASTKCDVASICDDCKSNPETT